MTDMAVMAPVCRSRRSSRRRSRAGNSAKASADRRTYAGAAPAARDGSDYRPGAGAGQTAAQGALTRTVGVSGSGCREHQSSADDAGEDRFPNHPLFTF